MVCLQSATDPQLVAIVRQACGVPAEERCHGAFRCGLAARRRRAPPPPLPPSALLRPQESSSGGASDDEQDLVVMGRLFVFDRTLVFQATHPYALARAPFLPRMYKFRLWRDVAALLPCRVASAPAAALALHLRSQAAAGAAEAAAEAQPCALLQEFSPYGEEDNRFFRNAVWEQCFDRLQETAVAEREAMSTQKTGEAPAAQQPDAASKRAGATDAAAAVRTAREE
jgi:hypothetical protein